MTGPPRWARRLAGRPAFQRLAFSLPLVRGVARGRAHDLFDLVAGFVHAQVLAACVELDLFAWTAERARTAGEVAARAGAPLDAVQRLLDAASALDLLVGEGGAYAPGPLGSPLAGPAGAGIAAMIGHHGGFYRDLADPLALLRTPDRATALKAFWPYAGTEDAGIVTAEDARPYSAVMAASQGFVAADVLDALGRSPCRSPSGPWLDLGGGDGAFLAAAARRRRRLRGTVFDLPAVAALAQDRFAREGLSHRLSAEGGDFRTTLPTGAFATVSLVRILHDHDEEAVLRILSAARRALAAGGRLVIAEPMRGRREDARITDAYFGLYLLAMGQGRLRTPAELARLAIAAGFSRVEERRTRRPFLVRLLVGRA